MFPARPCNIHSITGSKVERGGEVGELARPISPSGNKAREFAEIALAPDVETAFLRVP